MSQTLYNDKAASIIASVKGRALEMGERQERAVDLATALIQQAQQLETAEERAQQQLIAAMMDDPAGKVFVVRLADQCFRSSDERRTVSQIQFLLERYGVPRFLSGEKRVALALLKRLPTALARWLVPLLRRLLHKQMATVVIPGEEGVMERELARRQKRGVSINLNHLGEALLGEEEAHRRHALYLKALECDAVDCISVKVTTLTSRINLLAWEETLSLLEERLAALYRAAGDKIVNLDMEEYRHMELTLALFRRTLERGDCLGCRGGIVLQSYLPESFAWQQQLTAWAQQRCAEGGAPIRIRLVKGANLAMERVEAALHGWPQAPYVTKAETDAQFKRMVDFAIDRDRAAVAHVGIASHNLFDIAYALLLRAERGCEGSVSFEMLEGMAPALQRAVEQVAGPMLLYCPTATQRDIIYAIAYLLRRFDENSAPDNFLRHAFTLAPGEDAWVEQQRRFKAAVEASGDEGAPSRRRQDRSSDGEVGGAAFVNDASSDWTRPCNRRWIAAALDEWKAEAVVPAVIAGKTLDEGRLVDGIDPSRPAAATPLYRTCFVGDEAVDCALDAAVEAAKRPIDVELLAAVAMQLRKRRGALIAAMVADGGKVVSEADAEVSEAIDFVEYYRRSAAELLSMGDVVWKAKGVVLVAPPWNFPCAIPTGGIAAALATGNSVLFKPASESALVGWEVANAFWDAGVDRNTLQFFVCDDEPTGSRLIADLRLDSVILTGGVATAERMLSVRPNLDLHAELGGKNSIIVTRLADRDLAIQDIVDSAFGHAGQKCSACSLAIVEAELYDDPHFFRQLADATASRVVGSAWKPATEIGPLIHPPGEALSRALTTLEAGERWLLEPRQLTPHLWTPGIKVDVTPGSFTHQTELFGPLLGVIRAGNLDDAIAIANATPYGLTAGLHSLDLREQRHWKRKIIAGNLYINRAITGAIVQRQPFGGCKASSYGRGNKAGGANYLTQLMQPQQRELPTEGAPVSRAVVRLSKQLPQAITKEAVWNRSICSYSYFWSSCFSRDSDVTHLLGQDNIACYRPTPSCLRYSSGDALVDIARIVAAALTCGAPLEVSSADSAFLAMLRRLPAITPICESEEALAQRIEAGEVSQLRLLITPTAALLKACSRRRVPILSDPVMANGRIELLNHLREVSISCDYHRYGNLGMREYERRAPLIDPGA